MTRATAIRLPDPLGASAYPNVRSVELTAEDWASTPRDVLGRALLILMTVRLFEKWLIDHVDLVHGPLHSSIGQEAVAVGALLALEPADQITSNHRAHHHVLAKQITYHLPPAFDPFVEEDVPDAVLTSVGRTLAEILGLADGLAGGRGGSMHLADFEAGVLGTTAIVGGGIPIAAGAALAAKLRGTSNVVVDVLRRRGNLDRRLPRGTQPRAGVDAPGDLHRREQPLLGGDNGPRDRRLRRAGDPGERARHARARGRRHGPGGRHAGGRGRSHARARGTRAGPDRGSHLPLLPPERAAARQRVPYRTKDEEQAWRLRDPFTVLPRRLLEVGSLPRPRTSPTSTRLAEQLVEAGAVERVTIAETPTDRVIAAERLPGRHHARAAACSVPACRRSRTPECSIRHPIHEAAEITFVRRDLGSHRALAGARPRRLRHRRGGQPPGRRRHSGRPRTRCWPTRIGS